MDLIIGSKKSLFISNACNLGITFQLYNHMKNEKIHLETIAASIIAGIYLADLHAGLIHMFFDHYSGNNPIISRFHDDFIYHHKDPKHVLSSNLIARHSTISVENLLCLLYNTGSNKSTTQMITQLSFLTGTMLVQNSHQLSHYVNHATKEDRRRLKYKTARLLQKCNIILSPEIHRAHHLTENSCYCLLNGWANPLLDSIIYLSGSTAKQTSNKI
jgi:hypothetical protein